MKDNWQHVRQAVEQCSFPGWEIRFHHTCSLEGGHQHYLQVADERGTCNVTGESMSWSGRKWLLSRHMTKSEVVQTAFLAVMTAMEHEVREQFTYKGAMVMQPHRDLDVAAQLAATESVRDPMPALA